MTDFSAVLTALQAERDTCAARVAKLEAAIAGIVSLNLATPAPTAVKHRAPTKPDTSADDKGTRILAALRQHGEPMSPGALQRAVKLSQYVVSNALNSLSAKRLVVITGASVAKRVALPGSPAKEAL